MRGTAAEQTVNLPWLAPGVPALVALATGADPLVDPAVRSDPAALALVARFISRQNSEAITLGQHERSRLLRFASRRLQSPNKQQFRPQGDTWAQAARFAACAERIAHREHPALAFAARISACCLAVPKIAAADDTTAAPGGLLRRLAARWGWPNWLTSVVTHVELPVDVAERLGADPRLISIVRTAVAFVRDCGGKTFAEVTGDCLLPFERAETTHDVTAPATWSDPSTVELLPQLLTTAAKACRRSRDECIAVLNRQVDQLTGYLAERLRTEDERLRDRKLTALAEFAAGAGHEINTPLAIISGQAQYLLAREGEADQRKALQTVVQQVRRIHDILTDLMQYARPARPTRQMLDLALVAQDVAGALYELAMSRDVRIETELPERFLAFADPRQARTALLCLIRNGVEAAPAGGWVRVTGWTSADGQLGIAVEDSGDGPDPAALDHLFDPFYSGRPAGRGRGLGLPTAWRLAREQGGDVRYQPASAGPTRFVLTLPRADTLPHPELLSA